MSPARKTSGRAGGSAKGARKPPAGKSAAKKATGKKTPRKSAAKNTAAAKPAPRKGSSKTAKSTAKKTAGAKKKTAPKRGTGTQPAARKKTTAARRQPPTRRAAPPSAPARRVRRAKFDKAQLAAIRKELQGERSDLERQLAEIEAASSDATRSDRAGEIGADSDFADAGSATFERERELSIQNNMRDLIDQIGRALNRIDEGLYGICERCGRPIDAARLKALPHALLCMDCKRREERAR